jgi:DNA integrity scanning protein DisA with diadenylate cyclase activity
MFMPIFLENDLKTVVMRLAGDFRWEICKRIQGTRWNDMTDPSLTSYYCDYLQFYMNNRSIAMQTMTEIRNELSAARNNFKTVFLSNYVAWLQNESKGQARLNSLVIGIFMTFMPFTAAIRERLKTNMRYNEALTRYNIKRQKRAQRLTLLVKKLSQSGKGIPQEIRDELEFAQR